MRMSVKMKMGRVAMRQAQRAALTVLGGILTVRRLRNLLRPSTTAVCQKQVVCLFLGVCRVMVRRCPRWRGRTRSWNWLGRGKLLRRRRRRGLAGEARAIVRKASILL